MRLCLCLLACPLQVMERFLQGMHAMDAHYRSAPLQANLPVLLGLLNVSERKGAWRLCTGRGKVSSACRHILEGCVL